jgi:hypothetical protein
MVSLLENIQTNTRARKQMTVLHVFVFWDMKTCFQVMGTEDAWEYTVSFFAR